ncbi:hypothetical protein L596_023888 [Steinernema carpocapsae]|uniref:Uncharacterized protein n=1 Tax=Steinernema carpocapsae TaxID=34508 RepID=A0A4U5MF37_STECR|nr:hypothetical protein L596_023888 [Steinernema carpocapsae]
MFFEVSSHQFRSFSGIFVPFSSLRLIINPPFPDIDSLLSETHRCTNKGKTIDSHIQKRSEQWATQVLQYPWLPSGRVSHLGIDYKTRASSLRIIPLSIHFAIRNADSLGSFVVFNSPLSPSSPSTCSG